MVINFFKWTFEGDNMKCIVTVSANFIFSDWLGKTEIFSHTFENNLENFDLRSVFGPQLDNYSIQNINVKILN